MSKNPRPAAHTPGKENVTEKAIRLAIANWHVAGCLQLLRGG